MAKKLLLIFIPILLILGATAAWSALQYRHAASLKKSQKQAAEITLRFVEGWSVNDIAAYLQNDPKRTEATHLINKTDFLAEEKAFDAAQYELLSSRPQGADLEGFLFPDTYRFYLASLTSASATPAQISQIIISKMLDNFSDKFTPAMLAQAKKLNMSVYQIVTLASILEKESGSDISEKKIIAGIFYNRLKLNMPLQSDATVNYITQKGEASPSLADTEINSPYNTYKYPGLPKGPICNPSLMSLTAALSPTETDYLYFLHDQKTGQAIYAATYEEHLKNKQKYLK